MNSPERRQYELWKEEVKRLRSENQHLRLELDSCRPALYRAYRKIEKLENRLLTMTEENCILKQRLAELTPAQPSPTAPFVKASAPARRRRRPGRKPGHPAALRPMPLRIDEYRGVPLPKGSARGVCCPDCHGRLSDLKRHKRIVEDIIPASVHVTCYYTASGFCPACNRRVESRDAQQPPPADLPHAQLGPNALAMAASLRVNSRLPYRQVSEVLALAGLKVCPAALSRQIRRMGSWFEGEYEQLQRHIRKQSVVHADETGWRIDGHDAWLWTLAAAEHTLFHIDKSRGGKVIRKLLGSAYGGTLVSDFFSAYNRMNCRQQRCLVHLLRELHDTAQRSVPFAASGFYRRCRRLCKDMLLLKSRQAKFSASVYERRVRRLERRLKDLAATESQDGDVMRLVGRLRRHREQLTPFLRQAELDGTNNAAERALRPVVVARKISGGSRSSPAGRAYAVVASVVRTARQQGRNIFATLKTLIQRAWSGDHTPLLTPSG